VTEQLPQEQHAMTAEQQKCEDEVGHDFEHFPYEYDTNAGGYKQCSLCGWCEADDGDYGSDFDDNYM
jgi:hypothetical protein